jgi:hypothetical protein
MLRVACLEVEFGERKIRFDFFGAKKSNHCFQKLLLQKRLGNKKDVKENF